MTMLAIVHTTSLTGPTIAEVYVGPGLPSFDIVGVGGNLVRATRDRIRAAILSSRLAWPMQRTTVHFPTIPTPDPTHDLAIAIGILVATNQLPPAMLDRTYTGRLGLDGAIHTEPPTLRALIDTM